MNVFSFKGRCECLGRNFKGRFIRFQRRLLVILSDCTTAPSHQEHICRTFCPQTHKHKQKYKKIFNFFRLLQNSNLRRESEETKTECLFKIICDFNCSFLHEYFECSIRLNTKTTVLKASPRRLRCVAVSWFKKVSLEWNSVRTKKYIHICEIHRIFICEKREHITLHNCELLKVNHPSRNGISFIDHSQNLRSRNSHLKMWIHLSRIYLRSFVPRRAHWLTRLERQWLWTLFQTRIIYFSLFSQLQL